MSAALENTNINKIVLSSGTYDGTYNIVRPVEIDLAGNAITGTLNYNYNNDGLSKLVSGSAATVNKVVVNTPNASFEHGANVTITAVETIAVESGTYVNNGTIKTLTIPETATKAISFENNGTTEDIKVESDKEVTLSGSQAISKVTVSKAGAKVTVSEGTEVTNIEAQESITLENNGKVTTVTTNSGKEVTLSGKGDTPKQEGEGTVATPEISEQDAKLIKNKGLEKSQDAYKASFEWASTNGIGSGTVSKHTSPGGYKYFGNGAYLDITVKKDGDNLKFDDVLSSLTLQTGNEGAVDEISGGDKTNGRQPADWGKSSANHTGTKLKEAGSNSVFYGVRQNNTNGVATVGFNAEESRTVNLTATPKEGLTAGTYTITVQPKQQKSETSGKNLGDAITYSFIVEQAQGN